jgi:pimeloyl-ACP methyl ester carboxylesterase
VGVTTTPVVLVHGVRTSRTMWRCQLEALERAGRVAVAVDLPGHGTRIAERFVVGACIDVIAEAIDALGGRAVVVGESLGGYLGIAHAARHPDQVAGLVAASCCSVPDQLAAAAWLLVVRGIVRLPDKGAWLNQKLVDVTMPREAGLDVAEGGYALGVMEDVLAGMRRVDPLVDLARIRCPVWLVNGQLDHFRLQERAYLRAAGDARLVIIRGSNHMVSLVRPVAFNRAMLEALAEVDARGSDRRGADTRGSDRRGADAREAARPAVSVGHGARSDPAPGPALAAAPDPAPAAASTPVRDPAPTPVSDPVPLR